MSLFKRKDTGMWQATARRKGFKTESQSFALKAHAETWLRNKLNEFDARRAGLTPTGDQPTLRSLLERYRDEVLVTRKGERHDSLRINKFLHEQIFVNKPADMIDPDLFRAWRDERLKSVTGASVNRDMNVISGALTYAIKEGWVKLPANPLHLVKRPDKGKPRKQRASDADLEAIVGPFPTAKPNSKYEMVPYCAYFALETSMREGEISQIRWSDLNLKARTLHLRDEWIAGEGGDSIKNGTDRDVPLSKKAIQILETLSEHFPDAEWDDLVFNITASTLSEYWRRYTAAAGKRNIRFHDLRREATTRIAGKVKDVLKLSAITGHKDLKTLRNVYYTPDASELAAELD